MADLVTLSGLAVLATTYSVRGVEMDGWDEGEKETKKDIFKKPTWRGGRDHVKWCSAEVKRHMGKEREKEEEREKAEVVRKC